MTEKPPAETFEEFKNSFSYGSRSDMNFKFLKGLPEADAARFLQELLWKLGDSLNDGNMDRIAAHILAGQAQAYAGAGRFAYDEAPFTPLSRPVSELRLALVTSSGHFLAGDDPRPFGIENMTQEEAQARITEFSKEEPKLSEIPLGTPAEMLRVRHPGYDVRAAQADPNVNFPITRLREMQSEGNIGELFPVAYSFVGTTSQIRLQKHVGPEWVRMFQKNAIDAVVMVPV